MKGWADGKVTGCGGSNTVMPGPGCRHGVAASSLSSLSPCCWHSVIIVVIVVAVVWYCCARPRVPSRRRRHLWCCRCHRGVMAGSSSSLSSWQQRRHCRARPRVPSRHCGVVVVIVAVVVVVASSGCRQLEFHAGVVVGLSLSGEQKHSGTCVGVRSCALGEVVKFSVGILMVVYIDGYLVELTQRWQSTVRLY